MILQKCDLEYNLSFSATIATRDSLHPFFEILKNVNKQLH